jgi:hypothetical protein
MITRLVVATWALALLAAPAPQAPRKGLPLWRWQPTYENRQVLDGTHWGVEAAHDGRSIRSSGHMSFPGRTPAEVAGDPSEHGPLFDKYLAAVRKLLGGEPFQ